MQILLIDDHQLFLDGMKSVLSLLDNTVEIHTVDTGMKALDVIDKGLKFDIIILDIHMPNLNGFGFLRALKERKISTAVVAVSATHKEEDIVKILALGAKGFIPKETSADLLLQAVHSIVKGDFFLPAGLSHLLPTKKPSSLITQKNHNLTERQLETLQLIKDGLSNKQIAVVMNITESTVKHHVTALFSYFKANNRTSCINEADKHGFFSI